VTLLLGVVGTESVAATELARINIESTESAYGHDKVEAWRAAKNLPDEIKLNPDDLGIIADYMKRTGKSADDVAGEIPVESLTKSREWLGLRKLDGFLDSKPDVTLIPAPPGYQIYQVDNSKYIRRVNADDPYTPRLMVDGEDVIVPYVKPQRLAKNGKLRSNLENALGPAPPNHQAHHLISDNVVQKSDLYAEALSRNNDGKMFYDIDRPTNGKFLAEAAGDYKNSAGEWVSDSYKYPTHNGSHKAYDDAITAKVTDTEIRLRNEFGSLDKVPDDVMKLELELLEEEALLIMEEWKPSRLN